MDNRENSYSYYSRGLEIRMPNKFGLIRLDNSPSRHYELSYARLRYNNLLEKLINNERRKRLWIKALVKCVSSVVLIAVYLLAMIGLYLFLGSSIRMLGFPSGIGLCFLFLILFDKIDDLFETNVFRIKVKRRNKIYSINNSL